MVSQSACAPRLRAQCWVSCVSRVPTPQRWAEVRTGPGYDRVRHDPFIIEFNRALAALQSGARVWTNLNALPASATTVADPHRIETLFALQAIHGAETAARLVEERGLSAEALLSRTNLVIEVRTSLKQACEHATRAARLFESLRSAAPAP